MGQQHSQSAAVACRCRWLWQVFCEVAYRSVSVQNIVDGIDEFLDELIVLPPSIWDPSTRLEPPLTTRPKVPIFIVIISFAKAAIQIYITMTQ